MTDARVGPAVPGVTCLEIDGRIVALPPAGPEVIFFNDTASAVWRLADGTRTLDELLAELANMYGTDDETIADDVHRILADFVQAGLMPPGDSDCVDADN
jgi:hypothetical protein